MKKIILIILILAGRVLAQNDNSHFKYFFKPRPLNGLVSNTKNWDFKPLVQIPAIKVIESSRSNSLVDASFLVSAGGGLTLQRSYEKDNKNYVDLSWSPVIFLLSGETAKEKPLDLSVCTTVGFFNNLLQFGAGVDLGFVENRSRFFVVLSFGINLTNN